jgi:predicted RNase H-like HicB family nuclease
MTSRAVKLKVVASVPKDCAFWAEGDGWDGLCKELSVTVRGNSFEDAKRQMETALQDYVENVLRKHSKTRGKRIA